MGKIADDIIEGRCCAGCNGYFIKEHSYPVVCQECYDYGWTQYQIAIYPFMGEEQVGNI